MKQRAKASWPGLCGIRALPLRNMHGTQATGHYRSEAEAVIEEEPRPVTPVFALIRRSRREVGEPALEVEAAEWAGLTKAQAIDAAKKEAIRSDYRGDARLLNLNL
jgi:hypothetical protein